jgi:glycosyltransferase involved in cell wall biosynthesis
VGRLLGIPMIYDAHNIESDRIGSMDRVSKFYATTTELLEKVSCNVCDLIFVVSENEKRKMLSWNIPERKIKVVPNSIETDKFSTTIDGTNIRDRYNLNDKIVLIFHGT